MCEPFSRQQAKGRDDGTDHADQGWTAPHTFMLRREKESPTARASILVATARMSSLRPLVGSTEQLSPSSGIVSAAPDHVAADPCQQREGDPVIPRFDESAHGQAKGPSDHGHQELEKAERQRKAQKCTAVTRLRAQPAQTDTAKASMASATAMANSSGKLIGCYGG